MSALVAETSIGGNGMANIPVLKAVIPDPALAHVSHTHQGKVVRKALRTGKASSSQAVHANFLRLTGRVWTADCSQHAEIVT